MILEEMNQVEREVWRNEITSFESRFAHLFGRPVVRVQSTKYVLALTSDARRKNGWQVAQASGDVSPDATQGLLYLSKWNAEEARDVLQKYVAEVIGDEDGIAILDDTGFIKQGKKSAGVKRQYSGTEGKIENCWTYAKRRSWCTILSR